MKLEMKHDGNEKQEEEEMRVKRECRKTGLLDIILMSRKVSLSLFIYPNHKIIQDLFF